MSKDKQLKSEKLRIKNDKLREQGVDLKRKWGKQIINNGINSSAMPGLSDSNPTFLETKATKALGEKEFL